MAFDQATRNRLARFVGDARALLTEEFTRQLQLEYGLDPASGARVELDRLAQLDDARRATAVVLRETLDHYLAATSAKGQKATQEALDRIVREQAFTVLNRLCALRMAEARGIIIESVAQGYQSKGFQLYERLAGTALGETGDAYRAYLFSLCDELAVDLPVLFDRFAPEGRLFPRESALLELLSLLNHADLAELWAADETVGWVYQYFNSKDERQVMRDEQTPRNSRELAVRNQFFTPRYVVEFLTDNTLGRTWYEMTQGQTALVSSCRYLVRRPNEVFSDQLPVVSDQLSVASDQLPVTSEGSVGNEILTTDDSPLTTELSQEQLLQQPVHIPHRPLKDPRTILMLDPACGSMHFGLYAFDLFERIYAEAWDLQASGQWAVLSGQSSASNEGNDILTTDHRSLITDYPDTDAFLRDVPRLIVEHNIHGIDIDPRAAQIAGLALWLRAQRSWREQGLKAQDRPQITRSNIVCAEPMPGDPALLDEFVARELAATAEDKVVAQMLRRVFKAMELAGEAGSLLKIEEEIAGVIEAARHKYEQALLERRKAAGYLPGFAPERDTTLFDLLDLPNVEEFWQRAEERIYAALAAYAGFAEGSERFYRRRLFADDARQGFAFIDLCRKLYDVVLMNPPFGETTERVTAILQDTVPIAKKNTYIASVAIGRGRLLPNGWLGAITDATFIHQTRYEEFRNYLVDNSSHGIACLAANGWGVLDSYVETSSYIMQAQATEKALFIDIRKAEEDREKKLLEAVSAFKEGAIANNSVFVPISTFQKLPKSVLTFWLPVQILNSYRTLPSIAPELIDARCGMSSSDNFRFYKVWWEVSPNAISRQKKWSFLSNGGSPAPLFRQQVYLVNYERNGAEVKTRVKDLFGSESRTIINQPYYFRSGLTYGKRTESLSVQFLPREQVFSNEGQAIFPLDDTKVWHILAYLNTSMVAYLLNSIAGQHKEAGYVGSLPAPPHKFLDLSLVADHARENYRLLAHFAQAIPEAQSFAWPLVWANISEEHPFKAAVAAVCDSSDAFIQRFFETDQCLEIIMGYTSDADLQWVHRRWDISNILYECSSDRLGNIITQDLLGYLVGLAFGRWDIRYATGERSAPKLPDPFAPLPVCPPGMLQNAQGLPARNDEDIVAVSGQSSAVSEGNEQLTTDHRQLATYPLRISWPGILVDDEGHAEDIVGRVREAIAVIWGARAEAIEQEACEILGVKALRDYFARPASFFADHLARYSKSRRQAPIYWPLSFGGNYTLWLYYHRLSDQSLYSCVNDFVEPKLKVVSDQLSVISQKAGRSAKEEKELERLDGLRQELIGLREELLRVAAFWKPNLNDGVQITAAPLWRLFQHKPWQKRLKETWDKLEQGEYDWAHLAYSIWPERVREKCKTDRSLAIAHDLEALYVAPPAAAKKGRGRAKKVVVDEDEE